MTAPRSGAALGNAEDPATLELRSMQSRNDLAKSPPAGLVQAHAGSRRPSLFLSALVDALLPIDDGRLESKERERVVARVAEFSRQQIAALPATLRFLFRVGVLFFRLVTPLFKGQALCKLSDARRRQWVERWAYGGWSLGRKLFRPLRSLAIVAYYADPLVARSLEGHCVAGAEEPEGVAADA